MIGHMRHGSPPRLMALQSILSPNRRESLPTPSAGVRITAATFASRRHRPSPQPFLHCQGYKAFYARLTPSGNEGELRQSRSSGLAGERRQGPQNPLVSRSIERDRLALPVGIFLNDPRREPP